jgi:hypothetical protein
MTPDIGPEYIRDHPEELRARTLDTSNTNPVSGTGKTPVKASVHDDEVARLQAEGHDVVKAPADHADELAAAAEQRAREQATSPEAQTRETAVAPEQPAGSPAA